MASYPDGKVWPGGPSSQGLAGRAVERVSWRLCRVMENAVSIDAIAPSQRKQPAVSGAVTLQPCLRRAGSEGCAPSPDGRGVRRPARQFSGQFAQQTPTSDAQQFSPLQQLPPGVQQWPGSWSARTGGVSARNPPPVSATTVATKLTHLRAIEPPPSRYVNCTVDVVSARPVFL